MFIINRNSTWRYPNLGFWAIHAVSVAAMGFLAYKAADRNCGMVAENMSYPDRIPQAKEPHQL